MHAPMRPCMRVGGRSTTWLTTALGPHGAFRGTTASRRAPSASCASGPAWHGATAAAAAAGRGATAAAAPQAAAPAPGAMAGALTGRQALPLLPRMACISQGVLPRCAGASRQAHLEQQQLRAQLAAFPPRKFGRMHRCVLNMAAPAHAGWLHMSHVCLLSNKSSWCNCLRRAYCIAGCLVWPAAGSGSLPGVGAVRSGAARSAGGGGSIRRTGGIASAPPRGPHGPRCLQGGAAPGRQAGTSAGTVAGLAREWSCNRQAAHARGHARLCIDGCGSIRGACMAEGDRGRVPHCAEAHVGRL